MRTIDSICNSWKVKIKGESGNAAQIRNSKVIQKSLHLIGKSESVKSDTGKVDEEESQFKIMKVLV